LPFDVGAVVGHISLEFRQAISALQNVTQHCKASADRMSQAIRGTEPAIGGMAARWLTVGAAIGGAALAFQKYRSFVERGVESIDAISLAAISMAANLKTAAPAEEFSKLLGISRNMVAEIQNMDAAYVGTARELTGLVEAMMRGRSAQEAFTKMQTQAGRDQLVAFASVLRTLTGARDESMAIFQFQQEIRSIEEGRAAAGSSLVRILRSQFGVTADMLKNWQREGVLVDQILDRFAGHKAALGDIQNLLMTKRSTLETITDKILRAGMEPAYKAIAGWLEQITNALVYQEGELQGKLTPFAERIVQLFRDLWTYVEAAAAGLRAMLPPAGSILDLIRSTAARCVAWGGTLITIASTIIGMSAGMAAIRLLVGIIGKDLLVWATTLQGALGITRLVLAIIGAIAGYTIGRHLARQFEEASGAALRFLEIQSKVLEQYPHITRELPRLAKAHEDLEKALQREVMARKKVVDAWVALIGMEPEARRLRGEQSLLTEAVEESARGSVEGSEGILKLVGAWNAAAASVGRASERVGYWTAEAEEAEKQFRDLTDGVVTFGDRTEEADDATAKWQTRVQKLQGEIKFLRWEVAHLPRSWHAWSLAVAELTEKQREMEALRAPEKITTLGQVVRKFLVEAYEKARMAAFEYRLELERQVREGTRTEAVYRIMADRWAAFAKFWARLALGIDWARVSFNRFFEGVARQRQQMDMMETGLRAVAAASSVVGRAMLDAWEKMRYGVPEQADKIATVWVHTWERIEDAFADMIYGMMTRVSNFRDFVTEAWQAILHTVSQVLAAQMRAAITGQKAEVGLKLESPKLLQGLALFGQAVAVYSVATGNWVGAVVSLAASVYLQRMATAAQAAAAATQASAAATTMVAVATADIAADKMLVAAAGMREAADRMAAAAGAELAAGGAPWYLALALPFLQHGGIVTRPTVAMIGERPEAVVPLSSPAAPDLGARIVIENINLGVDGLDELSLRRLARRLPSAWGDEMARIGLRQRLGRIG